LCWSKLQIHAFLITKTKSITFPFFFGSSDVARRIVKMIKERGGRFLQKGPDGLYREITDDSAREKTSQALRHRTFEMRSKAAVKDLAASGAAASSTARGGGGGGDSKTITESQLAPKPSVDRPSKRSNAKGKKKGSSKAKKAKKQEPEENLPSRQQMARSDVESADARTLGAATGTNLLLSEQQRALVTQSLLLGMPHSHLGVAPRSTVTDESAQGDQQRQLLALQQQQQQLLLEELHRNQQHQLYFPLNGGLMPTVSLLDSATTRLLLEQDQNRRLLGVATGGAAGQSNQQDLSPQVQQHQPFLSSLLQLREREMAFAAEAEILRRQRIAMEAAGLIPFADLVANSAGAVGAGEAVVSESTNSESVAAQNENDDNPERMQKKRKV
jgi:hypothetical protein